jgi:hypothetical protein
LHSCFFPLSPNESNTDEQEKIDTAANIKVKSLISDFDDLKDRFMEIISDELQRQQLDIDGSHSLDSIRSKVMPGKRDNKNLLSFRHGYLFIEMENFLKSCLAYYSSA